MPQWAVSFPQPGINGCLKSIGKLLGFVVVLLTSGCWYGEHSDWGTCMWQELIQGLENVMNIQHTHFVLFKFIFLFGKVTALAPPRGPWRGRGGGEPPKERFKKCFRNYRKPWIP